jgi:hypothetical protein
MPSTPKFRFILHLKIFSAKNPLLAVGATANSFLTAITLLAVGATANSFLTAIR